MEELKKNITEKIIDEIWGRWSSIPILICISTLIGVWFSAQLSELSIIYTIVMFVALAILNIINVIYVVNSNVIKTAPKNKVGVLVYINALNSNMYKETKNKFCKEFEQGINNNLRVIFVPYFKVLRLNNKEIVRKLLIKKRCILFVKIEVNTQEMNKLTVYDLEVSTGIVHPQYSQNIMEAFKKEYKDITQIQIPKGNDIEQLKLSAQQVSNTCNYIMGLSFYLNGNILLAERILEDLYNDFEISDGKTNKLLNHTQAMLYNIYMIKSEIYRRMFEFSNEQDKCLKQMEFCICKANNYIKDTYAYYMGKAYCSVAIYDDIEEAKNCINLCKQMLPNNGYWKYSRAFIEAYENKSILKTISHYKTALKIDYDLQELVIYIERIMEMRQNRVGLYLALGILYEKIGDNLLAKANYEKYIEKQNDKNGVIDILRKRGFFLFVNEET